MFWCSLIRFYDYKKIIYQNTPNKNRIPNNIGCPTKRKQTQRSPYLLRSTIGNETFTLEDMTHSHAAPDPPTQPDYLKGIYEAITLLALRIDQSSSCPSSTHPSTSTPSRSPSSFSFETLVPSPPPPWTQAHPQHSSINATPIFNLSMVPLTIPKFVPPVSHSPHREQLFTFQSPPLYNEREEEEAPNFAFPLQTPYAPLRKNLSIGMDGMREKMDKILREMEKLKISRQLGVTNIWGASSKKFLSPGFFKVW